MPNWVKKTGRRARPVLGADEEIVAAIFVRPRTSEGTKRLGRPGVALGREALVDDDAAQLADSVPAVNCVLALTPDRLLVFGHGTLTGRVRGLVAEFHRHDVEDIVRAPDSGPGAIEIIFVDGSTTDFTAGTRISQFIERWDQTTPATIPPS